MRSIHHRAATLAIGALAVLSAAACSSDEFDGLLRRHIGDVLGGVV